MINGHGAGAAGLGVAAIVSQWRDRLDEVPLLAKVAGHHIFMC